MWPNRTSTSGQDGIIAIVCTLLSETTPKNKTMTFKILAIRLWRTVTPKRWETNEVSPTIAPAHHGDKVFRPWCRERALLELGRQSWEGGTPMWPESEGQRGKRTGLPRESSGHLQTGPSVFSWAWSVLACEEATPGWGKNHPAGLAGTIPTAPWSLGIAPHPANHGTEFHNLCSIESNTQRVLPKD